MGPGLGEGAFAIGRARGGRRDKKRGKGGRDGAKEKERGLER